MEDWLSTVVGRYHMGFCRGHRLAEHITAIKMLAQQGTAGGINTFACFLDFQATYNLVPRDFVF